MTGTFPGSALLRAALLTGLLAVAGCPKKTPSTDPAGAPDPKPRRGDPQPTVEEPPPVVETLTAPQKVERATALLTTGSNDDALRARDLLQEVVDAGPDDVLARFNLGVAHQRTGDLEAAAESFSRVIRDDNNFVRAWLYLGLVERQLGDADAALRRFKTALASHPDDLDLRLALISALRETGQVDQANTEARSALQVNSRSLPVYAEMGLSYLAKDNLDMARFVYEKADSIPGAENNPPLQAGFGWVLYRQGERYPAEYRLKRALELDPGYTEAQVWLARLYTVDHNWTAAVPLLESASAADPRRAGLLLDLGNAYRGLDRFDDAMRVWKRALELDPRNPVGHFNLGVVLGDNLKRYDDGITELEAYVGASGPDAELARTYIESFRKEKARAEQRKKSEEDRARRQKEKEERTKAEAEKAKAEAAQKPAAPPEETPPADPPPAEQTPASPWGPTAVPPQEP